MCRRNCAFGSGVRLALVPALQRPLVEAKTMQATQPTEVRRISAEEVKARLGRGERIVFLDSRNPTAWAESDVKLPGAIRVEADRVRDHLGEIPRGRPIVAYCT
jgi:hypothetical protein